jgi:polyhydroxyalkanoate synthesis regulator phasin
VKPTTPTTIEERRYRDYCALIIELCASGEVTREEAQAQIDALDRPKKPKPHVERREWREAKIIRLKDEYEKARAARATEHQGGAVDLEKAA